ncbi:response regulator transcription factor [Opitutus terrae]|uniref:Two component transcriptional regulator, LuxR family n=1 Tax=Opitutus terrae (strain DSM 11246 / JCM 15787 / PB90-1) TaxID=452637 RepID=B1ZVR8_OPITP|nr:response regulator transcription factor [Opitutus terrae]ACB75004.1 two component transcriptional regulator, LuxR family [Opitutus terrae PB90-1]
MTKTVLIIDDVPANVGVLLDVLAAAGFEVAVAESGQSALEQLAWLKPDIILLDVLMPGLDGFETCRRLKAREATADVPVLFMTALTEVVDKVKGFAAGAVDYLAKPLHPEEVLARVNAHLKIREQQQLLEQRADELDREVQRRVLAEREVQRVLERGLIVIGAKDEILFASDRARTLLTRHFPGVTGSRVVLALLTGELPAGLKLSAPADRTTRPLVVHLDEVPRAASPAQLAPLGLTPRETEILFWVAQGKTNAEIGTILGAAPATVKKHVENLLPKLGVETRLAAALRATELLSGGAAG